MIGLRRVCSLTNKQSSDPWFFSIRVPWFGSVLHGQFILATGRLVNKSRGRVRRSASLYSVLRTQRQYHRDIEAVDRLALSEPFFSAIQEPGSTAVLVFQIADLRSHTGVAVRVEVLSVPVNCIPNKGQKPQEGLSVVSLSSQPRQGPYLSSVIIIDAREKTMVAGISLCGTVPGEIRMLFETTTPYREKRSRFETDRQLKGSHSLWVRYA